MSKDISLPVAVTEGICPDVEPLVLPPEPKRSHPARTVATAATISIAPTSHPSRPARPIDRTLPPLRIPHLTTLDGPFPRTDEHARSVRTSSIPVSRRSRKRIWSRMRKQIQVSWEVLLDPPF